MPKYRKKPVVIEAFLLTVETRWDNSEWPNWMHKAWNTGGEGGLWPDPDAPVAEGEKSSRDLCIGTKEGVMRCPVGRWIIQGVEGEIYCCENGIFEKTYEKVEGDL